MTEEIQYAPMLCAEFRAWRKNLNLTQADAARLLDRSVTHINNYERGRTKIPRSIQLATVALSLSSADAKPQRDGRYKKLIDYEALGKVVYHYTSFGEEGQKAWDKDSKLIPNGVKGDPASRQRRHTLEEALLLFTPYWTVIHSEERDDGFHIWLAGSEKYLPELK